MVRTRIKYGDNSLFSHTKSNEFHLMYGNKDISWYILALGNYGLDLIPGLSANWFDTNDKTKLIVNPDCDVI